MNIVIVDKSYLVEIAASTLALVETVYYFPTLENLDGKLTQGLSFYSPAVLTKTKQNRTVINQNVLACSYLTLVIGSDNQIWNLPLIDLLYHGRDTVATTRTPFALEFNNLPVIWAKSFITIADPTTLAATSESFVCNIKYTDNK